LNEPNDSENQKPELEEAVAERVDTLKVKNKANDAELERKKEVT
jgi:hypothetical protein